MARWIALLRNTRPGGFSAPDAVLAVFLLLVAVASVLAGQPDEGPAAVTVPAAVAMTASMAWRRRVPLVPAVACAAANLFQGWLAQTPGSLWSLVAFSIAMYSVAAWSAEGPAAVGGALLLAALLAGEWLVQGPDYLFIVLLFGGIWLLGRAARVWRGRLSRQQLHERDAAKLAVAEERLRIARELHDVLGHSMSVIAVQSDAAGAALGQDPDLARKPLQVIHATARGSLAEIRAMLEVLHGDSGQEPGGPGLDELRTLLEANALAGLDVSGTISPGLPALSPAAGLVVFRVVQESLTNVLKHAGPVPAVVSVAPEGPGVRVEIRNGPGAGSGHDSGSAGSAGHAAGPPGSAGHAAGPPGSDGYGLQGLRERVGQVGGTFGAGAGDGGGWLVWAVVPAQAGGGEEPP